MVFFLKSQFFWGIFEVKAKKKRNPKLGFSFYVECEIACEITPKQLRIRC